MKRKKTVLLIGLLSIALVSLLAMNHPEVIDYLSIGKQLDFNKEKYDLKWSSHPSENYYKQEYLKQGEEYGSYHNMLLVEAIEGNLKIKDAVKTKVQELETRKKWDAFANYQVLDNKGKNESIIDFISSDTGYIYEWNLYRYQQQITDDKKNYLVLFAYSYRDSLNDNNELKKFGEHIKENRTALFNKLQDYSIPEIKIKK